MICERPKGKRVMILTAREQYLPTLNYADLDSFGGFGDRSLWSKISSKGIFLVSSPRPATDALFGMKAYQLFGKCLLDFVHDDDYEKLRFALNGVLEGKICLVHHRLRHKNDYKWVESIFFPGGYHYPVGRISAIPSPNIDGNLPSMPIVAYMFHKMTRLFNEPLNTDAQFFGTRPIMNPDAEDVFSAFSPDKETSWQYELHMLKTEHRNILESVGLATSVDEQEAIP